MPPAVPLHSMTGYGTASRRWVSDDGPWSLDAEVRSVNARFLEIKVRQPFGAAAEQAVRRTVEGALGRGRVEVSLHLRTAVASDDAGPDPLAAAGVDSAQVKVALAAIAELDRLAAVDGKVELARPTAIEVLRFCQGGSRGPSSPSDTAPTAPDCLDEVVAEAVATLQGFREREGEALATALTELAEQLAAQVAALTATLAPEGERIAARVTKRLGDLRSRMGADSIDPERVAQEIAMVVARGDIAEELARIASHLAQMREVIEGPAQAGQGKTLEFVAQELLREITTIGSKITSHEGSRIVIEAKGSLERIREQVHNVQ